MGIMDWVGSLIMIAGAAYIYWALRNRQFPFDILMMQPAQQQQQMMLVTPMTPQQQQMMSAGMMPNIPGSAPSTGGSSTLPSVSNQIQPLPTIPGHTVVIGAHPATPPPVPKPSPGKMYPCFDGFGGIHEYLQNRFACCQKYGKVCPDGSMACWSDPCPGEMPITMAAPPVMQPTVQPMPLPMRMMVPTPPPAMMMPPAMMAAGCPAQRTSTGVCVNCGKTDPLCCGPGHKGTCHSECMFNPAGVNTPACKQCLSVCGTYNGLCNCSTGMPT